MEVISFIALVLLSTVGYSAGAVIRVGKSAQPKPQTIDLFVVPIVWVGAAYSRITFDLNEWLAMLIWMVLGSLVGMVAVRSRKLSGERASVSRGPEINSPNITKKLWQGWVNFSRRMGNFHTGIVFSLFFFVLVTPIASAVKILSDPLRIRYRDKESYWLPKARTKFNLEQFRRQF